MVWTETVAARASKVGLCCNKWATSWSVGVSSRASLTRVPRFIIDSAAQAAGHLLKVIHHQGGHTQHQIGLLLVVRRSVTGPVATISLLYVSVEEQHH